MVRIIAAFILLGVFLHCPLSHGQSGSRGASTPESKSKRISVIDFGAVADGKTDCSPAFQKAVHQLIAAGGGYGGGYLHIPAGKYCLNKQIVADVNFWQITVAGDGEGVSEILVNNADGALSFKQKSNASQVTIRDLSILTSLDGAGTALEIISPEGGNRHNRSLLLEHVEIRGVTMQSGFFNCGIRAIGQWRPLFLNVVFSGPFGPQISGDLTETSPMYRADVGISADGCYAPSFEHCYVWSARTGYSLVSKRDPGPEDASFRRSFAVGCRVGMDIRTRGMEPQLVIDACHINCRDIGVRIQGRKFFQIVNSLFYNDDFKSSAPAYKDLILTNCFGGVISGNVFHQPGNSNRTMIEITEKSRELLIQQNIFNARGIPIAVPKNASDLSFTNNLFTGEQKKVIDPAH